MKLQLALHSYSYAGIVDGAQVRLSGKREVVVMATSGRYAMAKVKGCFPFVVLRKDLQLIGDAE